ncbi:DUF350 domain-containing protein [Ferrimonas marina]|uniref:DUF350 domain-containing protein n=1 Tax=Ferrimonas marina TaxID=299255 RepID=A0A1M5ZFF5_9GAMM|nr:DUF350 domain-containing protein [Ferrimonas marina]SHI22947.1 protein of unknown function [Ferrimonas marina]
MEWINYWQAWSQHYPLSEILVELAVAAVLFVIARFSHGWFAGVDTREELAERDNIAFGISVAGGFIALAVSLSGVFKLPGQATLWQDALWMLGLGLAAILLIRFGRWWYDKWGLNQVDKREQILKGNVAMAIVDGAVAVAIAMVLKGMLLWLGELSAAALPLLVFNFFIAISFLVLLTRLLELGYRRNNQGGSLQQALAHDHRPVALRHSGYLLACGLVIQTSGHFHPYQAHMPLLNVAAWLLWALFGLALLVLCSWALRRLVLTQVKVSLEVELQNNAGVAALEGALVFATAYVLSMVLLP